MNKQLDALDLNLMKLLKVVVETKNTHLAAEKLGISQTSVSRGLTKLREVFGSQLFIRKAHGVEPSELAEKLAEAADQMLEPIGKVIESYQNFDPQTFNGSITIAVNVFALEVIGPEFLKTLSASLPKAKFNIVYWENQSLCDMLNGNIDYMIQYANYPLPQEVYTHTLKCVQHCIVARKNHPVLSKSSAWEDIHSLPLIRLLDNFNTKRNIIDIEEIYLQKGYIADVVLATHSLKTALEYLENSDALLFESTYFRELSQGLDSYSLPPLDQKYNQHNINGGYLQTRRGYPLNQHLHQTIQSFFDRLIQPA